MKIISCLFLFIILFFQLSAIAAEKPVFVEKDGKYLESSILKTIRLGEDSQKLRIVLDIEGKAYYKFDKDERYLNIYLLNAKADPAIPNVFEVKDHIINYVKVTNHENGLLLKIYLPHVVSYNIFSLGDPSRLVVDFDRAFVETKDYETVADGVCFYRVLKTIGDKYVLANILEVDPKKTVISPGFGEPEIGFLDSVLRFFNSQDKEKQPGFYKTTVSKQNDAIAAVNGTYFSWAGLPLGVFMVNSEIISYPIYDRTAVVITKENNLYIDNITMDSYFTHGDIKYSITGINEPRTSRKDIILYTPRYGASVQAKSTDFNIIVEDGFVKGRSCGDTIIPSNGFVLSAGDMYTEFLSSTVKNGDKIKVVVNIIPYSTTITGEVLHLIGGGPRLLKSGRIYISKYEEKFRPDIAQGRAARTAVGIKKDSKLLFVTVNGKPRGKDNEKSDDKEYSIGMTLTELAYFLKTLGAVDALNFDGGGSSTTVVRGNIKNIPVDGAERKVGNAILIKPVN